ncbi:hypothetical protein ACHAWC_001417 [Mediolabrus comicus]
MKLTAAAVTLATFAGASASSGNSKSSKSSPSPDKFEGNWRECEENHIYQFGGPDPVWFPSGVGNNPLVITKLDLPGAAKFSARKTSVLGCVNVWDDIVPHCSNVPTTGSTEFYSYSVAAQSYSSKSQDMLQFTGHYVSYLDANGDEVPYLGNADDEIHSLTCTVEYDGEALACDQDTFGKASQGLLAGQPLLSNSSFLYVRDGDDFETKCAELSLAR